MNPTAASLPARVRIDVKRLTFSPGMTTLLHGVSFQVRPGECLGILGPSGAGKSTLLKLVNGFEREAEGEIRYQGRDFYADYAALKTLVGYVPQDDIVHPSLSPAQELRYSGLLRMPEAPEARVERRMEEVLRVLELHEVAGLRNSRLSGGQRKRVSIGVELMTSPPVLFLDEPTSGLDPALEEKMMRLFQRLAREGRTVLLTTHVMESLDALDLVLVLVKGRLVFFGPPREALGYFKVQRFAEIYPRLETRTPDEWKAAFASSDVHRRWVAERLAEPVSDEPAPPPDRPEPATGPRVAGPPTGTDRPPGFAPAPPPRPVAAAPADEEASLDDELEALKREVRS